MKQEFITVNHAIQDYDEYVKNIILLKNYLKSKIKELLFEESFALTENHNSKYHESSLIFYNQEKDLQVEVMIRKKDAEAFV